MTKRILMFVFAAVLALAAIGRAAAQEQNMNREAVQDKNAATGLSIGMLASQRCFTSGGGVTFLKICITDNGNISWFESPAGKVHLQNREGYAVCSGGVGGPSSVIHGFDASVAANGWGTPTIAQPNGAGTFPLIITRKSLDGVIQLKQTFTLNAGERGIDVKMDVQNMTAMYLFSVYMSRYFDGDIDSATKNVYDFTHDSVWGKDTLQYTRGLMLTAAPSANLSGLTPEVDSYANWDPFGSGKQYARGCDYEAYYPESVGDFVGGLSMSRSQLNPGQTISVTLRYRRF
jgi:hypothetical protein